jgi:hypothetical protein
MKKFLLIIIILLIPVLLMASVSEKRVALIIGNAAYKSMPLQNTLNDARAMENALRECDFQIIRELDASRTSMRKAIRTFGDKIKGGGVGLFYYAGHALQVKGENFLVPIGASVFSEDEVMDECLRASSVVRKMETAGNRLNILILDACRNNPFRSFRSTAQGLAEMHAPAGTIIQYATAKGSVARDQDDNRQNGLYTSKLMDHILTPGIEVRKMFSLVREDVYKASNKDQLPWEANSMMGGDFYFKPLYADGSTTIIKPQPQMNLQTGALRIKTNPTSAEVYVNNAYKGESPQDISGLNPGEVRIRVQKEGYKTVYQNTRITSGEINILSSIESIGIGTFLGRCLQLVIKIFQTDGLIAMMSLLLIEFFLSMHLASGWHKKLAHQSEGLFHTLSINVCKQLMFTLHESVRPLTDWASQAQLDCEKLHKIRA